ncbi:DUF3784 domain-containing protein [Chryseobacterium suipulveris]|uniref:DUF3784 domain-containing protein n=1 Tax=Chryseobacterium suipulveris TaxID=2929800 RepID=A0ABY4BKR8_9FLAO|nr:DUF3784 domain-containing protein [Chryseobacterium suipulveris]UOE39788.1 DUF3784 domain-containing protein [Chryseobacterium suipulveris]
MIVPITILSILFIGIGFIITEKNAKYLLSGYNTMSENERGKFDIKSYIPYFRNFHIFLGLSLFVICLSVYYFIDPDWSGIVMTTYPIIAYIFFVWKGNQFSKLNNKKSNRKTIMTMIFLVVVFITIAGMFLNSLNDNNIDITGNTIKIKGDYGMELKKSDIKSIKLVNELPEISYKMNGFALQNVKKGYFKTKTGEKVKLFINSDKYPLIYIITEDNQKIYYSSKEKSNNIVFKDLKTAISK